MLQLRLRISFLILVICCSLASGAQKIIAGTYNIRMQTPADSGNLWVNRAPMVAALLRFHQFDIFGTQEGFRNQLNDITRALPDFEFYGAGRDDGKEKGEHSAIFFKKDRFTLLNKGDFWLSETPDQPSKGWDGKCCNRICTWVYLEDKQTHKRFYYFNAHFDHEGTTARLESSKLILQRIQTIAGTQPVVLTGDFNCGQQSEPYLNIVNSGIISDAFRKTNFPYANNGTFNGFGRTIGTTEIIDHVFVTDHFLVSRWGILSDSYLGKYPSDHFPVLAEITLK
jgi:endonuclease/exonuclease/phosphatase family metal-dependent hydrolase